MQTNLRIVITLMLTVLLSACGFQLQAERNYPVGLSPLVFASEVPAGELYDTLVTVFAQQSLRLSQRPADVLLSIHELDYQQARIGQFDAVQATVQWSLVNAWGEPVIYKQWLVESAEVQRNAAEPNRFGELTEQVNQQIAAALLAQLRAISSEALLGEGAQ